MKNFNMNRRIFLSLLVIPAMPIPIKLPLLQNGDLIEVYYCDTNTFGDPWKPKWIKCVVDNDKCRCIGNKKYFQKEWMINHYYWRYTNKPNQIFKPKQREHINERL